MPLTLALAAAYDVDIKWMGKHTLFWGPFGPFFRWLGGIPIRRHERRNVVGQAADLFDEIDDLILTVPAEGTRSKVEYWKSGFYHIARQAEVPIVLGFLDFARKRGGFGPAVEAGDDVKAVMDRIREFYADKTGLRPELWSEPRLREEDAPPQ